jgi:predicted ATP-grasp superfamily ATP-dependent carboligase
MAVARDLDVPVPRQVELVTPGCHEVVEREIRELGLPLVLKPARSVVPEGRGVRLVGVRSFPTPSAAIEALGEFPDEAYPILVQEHISGPGLGAFFLCKQGSSVASFAHRRIREKPPTGGVSVYRESVPLRDDVRTCSERILAHFGWNGVAMVEFKEDRATGTPYLMEVNARFWGSLQLAVDAGVDFPALLVQLSLGEECAGVSSYRTGVRSRWLWGDFDHLLWLLRASKARRRMDPTLPGRLRAVGRFLVPWRPGDRLEVLRAGDPGPFLRESARWFSGLGGAA